MRGLLIRFSERVLDSHHDPFQIAGGPDGGVWEDVVKGPQNRLCFLWLQLVDREPKRNDATVFQAIAHEREEFFGVEIDRPHHLQRRRFSSDDVVFVAGGLQKEPAVLHESFDPRIAQRIGISRP